MRIERLDLIDLSCLLTPWAGPQTVGVVGTFAERCEDVTTVMIIVVIGIAIVVISRALGARENKCRFRNGSCLRLEDLLESERSN